MLGDGKYIVVPRSIHKNGTQYAFRKEHSFKSIAVAELPDKWLDRLLNPINIKNKDWIPSGQNEITQKLASIVGGLHNKNVALTDILNMMQALHGDNSNNNLESLISSITSNPVRENHEQPTDAAYTVAYKLLDKSYDGGKHLIYAMDSKFYTYNGKIWVNVDEKVLRKELFSEAGILSSTDSKIIRKGYDNVIKQALSILQAKQADNNDVFNFTKSPHAVINCNNGEVWIDTKGNAELKPHNKNSYLTHFLPIDYDEGAKCPRFKKALKEIFKNSEFPNAMTNFFAEIMGYIIQPKRNIPLVIILLGGGQNGKTTVMSIIYKILGEDLVYFCNDIQDLAKNKFVLSELCGKRLVVDDDVRNGTRLPDGILKKIPIAILY